MHTSLSKAVVIGQLILMTHFLFPILGQGPELISGRIKPPGQQIVPTHHNVRKDYFSLELARHAISCSDFSRSG